VVTVDIQLDCIRGWCEEHAPQVGALVPVGVYMVEACRQLEARYPSVEFITWYEGDTDG
jgi:hypothetical protein